MEAANPNGDIAEISRLRAVYLDLMRDSLIGLLNQDPPLPASKVDAYYENVRAEGWDWPSAAPSMIGLKRMQNVRAACERVLADGVPGDFMETGVWRGGACMMMRAVLKAYGVADRRVIAADSFSGVPAPSPDIIQDQGANLHTIPEFSVSRREVEANFARYGLLDNQVVFLEGLFRDTLPVAAVGRLAILRLDGDLYESTRDALVNLYDKLSPGGSLIVDDYHLWEGQRAAVDEFRSSRGISETLVRIDDWAVYWDKSKS